MIRIDICSDLHVDKHEITEAMLESWMVDDHSLYERPLFDFARYRNPGSNIIVIAGDISDRIDQVEEVILAATQVYEYVVFVDGNHEHVETSRAKTSNVEQNMQALRDMSRDIPGMVYLDGIENCRWDFQDVAFIGGNGWYDWKCFESQGIPFTRAFVSWADHAGDRQIDFGDYGYPNSIAAIHSVNMAAEMDKATKDPNIRKVVAVTHTAPIGSLLRWHVSDFEHNSVTPSFANSSMQTVLDADINEKLAAWIYGHTHDRKFTMRGNSAFINNAYGYVHEIMSTAWTMVNYEV